MPGMEIEPGTAKPSSRSPAWLYVVLALLVIAAYARVPTLDFVNYDDNKYVYDNPRVLEGLTPANIRWAFTTGHVSNWHPLTWLSLMADQTVWPPVPGDPESNAAFPHLVNLAFHVANTLLLLLLLHRLTGRLWPAAAAAAIFGLHPAHVESVAWVSERKDVLCALFWILTLLAYRRYVSAPSAGRYLGTLALFGLGLLSKPMIVSLPVIMLALDFWPLNRLATPTRPGVNPLKLLLEKVPFFALALASCVATVLMQRAGGAMAVAETLPLSLKLGNAAYSYALYIKMLFWPTNLVPIVPHPGASLSMPAVITSSIFLAATFGVVFACRRRHPYLLTGWLWYFISLLPVIGIVMVGMQAIADRYTYLPYIGLSLMVCWGVEAWIERHPRAFAKLRGPAIGLGLLLLLTGVVATSLQTRYWQNSITLFSRTLALNPTIIPVMNNLANALADEGRTDEAIAEYKKALALRPDHVKIRCDLANAYVRANQPEAAIRECQTALTYDRNAYHAYNNMGVAYARLRDYDKAQHYFDTALLIDPTNPLAQTNLSLLKERKKKGTP